MGGRGWVLVSSLTGCIPDFFFQGSAPQAIPAIQKIQRKKKERTTPNQPADSLATPPAAATAAMISSLCWVPKGAAKPVPSRFVRPEDDVEEEEGGTSGLGGSQKGGKAKLSHLPAGVNRDEIIAKYNLDTYDEEEEGGVMGVSDRPYYASNKEDPYLTSKDEAEEEEELEEFTIRDTDALILAATTDKEDSHSHLDVHVYETEENHRYIHHDILLGLFPLCLAWTDAAKSDGGSFVAVGTFEPAIEIWDLDVVNVVQPVVTLGGYNTSTTNSGPSRTSTVPRHLQRKKKKRAAKPTLIPGSHVDAVTGLSWNKQHKNLLSSSSADCTIKVWDLESHKCLQTYQHHKDKVQSVTWHPVESNIMLSGAFDRTVAVFDARRPDAFVSWTTSADVEAILWNLHSPKHFLVSTEDGQISCFTTDMPGKPLWSFHAHSAAATSISLNPQIPNFLASVSHDKTLKLWDLSKDEPVCLLSNETGLGKTFTVAFNEDWPLLVAAGGKNGMKIWDTASNETALWRFVLAKRSSKALATFLACFVLKMDG
ncbi:rRNA-processing protein [Balamuthia mandrillaris]